MEDSNGTAIKELTIKEFYSKVWDEYADPVHHPITAHALTVQSHIVSERIRRSGSKTVLDLGCGPAPVVEPGDAPLVVYADLVREMLLRIRKAEGYRTVCLDARELPFRDKSFDLIWCGLLVDHIRSPRNWFRELSRILLPGGMLGLACWERCRLPHERYPENTKMRYTTSQGEELFVSSHPNWVEALEALKDLDPQFKLKSFPIHEDEYILQVAFARVKNPDPEDQALIEP